MEQELSGSFVIPGSWSSPAENPAPMLDGELKQLEPWLDPFVAEGSEDEADDTLPLLRSGVGEAKPTTGSAHRALCALPRRA